MYASRQQAMYTNPEVKKNTKPSNFKIDDITVHAIPHLSDSKDIKISSTRNEFQRTKMGYTSDGGKHKRQYRFVKDEVIMLDIVRAGKDNTATSFVRAGPREKIVFEPGEVKAAVVTCGGLCPGLNDVVAEIFRTLYYNYGVDNVYGIKGGFRGFWDASYRPWNLLTPENTTGIQDLGGSVLGSSRGGFDATKIVDACLLHGVNQIYIVGGDGTHRAALKIHSEAVTRGLKITVAGVPKTIDNDIGIIDRSFGFNTAVAEARNAIRSATVEARAYPNGVGVVQLMGRHCGYITALATLAARSVDFCIIPENELRMEGPDGLYSALRQVLKTRGHAVIVVAEGAGSELLSTNEKDESGNAVLPEIGRWLSKQIKNKFKKDFDTAISIKYHDPSYMIRSVPAAAEDSIYCQSIAQNAVHGAMAGYTGFSSGLVNNRTVLLPMSLICQTSPSFLNPSGRTWERVLSVTHQPRWAKRKSDH